MKYLVLFILLNPFIFFSQEENCEFYINEENLKIYTSLTVDPIPSITEKTLFEYLFKNISLDSLQPSEEITSKTIMKFILSPDAEIIQTTIVKLGIEGVSDQIIGLMEKLNWQAGICGTTKVYTQITVSLNICLH